MKHTNNLSPVKRIAVVASTDKRKELIEWSYQHKDMLGQHQLVATSKTAYILEGTVNRPVQKLVGENTGGYQLMAEMIRNREVDIIVFFENPMRSPRLGDLNQKLLDLALEMNIVIAGEQSPLDFVKATA